MELGDRKRKILQSIVEEYVSSAEPIGSRTIAKHTNMGLSSATIRNEMADLEEMGYLISPHTSAGRIPSDAGYRFYVNELMSYSPVPPEKTIQLKEFFTSNALQLDRLIQQVGQVLANITSHTAVTITPEIKKSYVKRFELLPVDEYSVLLVLVTSEGIVRNQLISIRADEFSIRSISAALNERLTGLTLEEINLLETNELRQMLGVNTKVLMSILNFVHDVITEMDGSEVYIADVQNILKHPEYYDVSKARELLSFFEKKQSLKNAADQVQGDDSRRINVIIGKENKYSEMQETSMIIANYLSRGRSLGKIGIIGPTRMDYAKVVSALDCIIRCLDEVIDELYN